MVDFLKSRWVLIVVLTLFIVLKIPHLLYPFYWDECWPYVPAIKEMYRHGISLIPNAIDPNLSRGHPLFFHAAGAAWMHIFGGTNFSLHCFALFISVLFLITIFEAGYRIFNERVATISLLLVATHVSFFVQSSFVLFEMLVAFLAFLSIYLYVREKYFFATLTLTALFLTKESGLMAGFVIGIDALISLFNTKTAFKARILKLIPVTVACISIGAFFLIQKHITGWYVLPLYSDTILHKWIDIFYRFGTCVVATVFCEAYEYVIFILLVIYAIIMIVKNKSIKNTSLLTIIIPFIIAYYICIDPRIYTLYFNHLYPGIPTLLVFMLFSSCYIITLFSFARPKFYQNTMQVRFIILSGMFVLSFVFFSSTAYFIPRYLLTSIVTVLFLLAVFFDMLIRYSYKILYYPLLIVILLSAFYSFRNNKGWGDCDLGFINGVKTQDGVVKFMEKSNLYDEHIATSSYLEKEHLIDPNTGFLSSEKNFKHVTYDIDSSTNYMIFDNIEPDSRHDMIAKDTTYQLINKITNGPVWAEIYKKK